MSAGASDPRRFPFTFECRRSGNCCARPGGVVRVDAEDVARIAAFLGLEERAFRSRFLAPSQDRLADGSGPACVFLADGTVAACTIHPVRPAQCRSWPFWPELLEDPELLAEARRLCPGIRDREPGSTDPADPGTMPRRP